MKLILSSLAAGQTYSHLTLSADLSAETLVKAEALALVGIHSTPQVLHSLVKIERHPEPIYRQAGLFQDLTALISFPKKY